MIYNKDTVQVSACILIIFCLIISNNVIFPKFVKKQQLLTIFSFCSDYSFVCKKIVFSKRMKKKKKQAKKA